MSDPVTEPTDSTDPTVVATPSPPAPSGAGRTPTTDPARRSRGARSRHARVVVRKVGPWSVFKISLFFYLCVMAVVLGAFVILYGVLGAIGSLDSLQRLIRDLFADQSFQIHGQWLFSRALVVGFAMVVLWTLINVFVAFLYNLLSDIVGGVEVTLSEPR